MDRPSVLIEAVSASFLEMPLVAPPHASILSISTVVWVSSCPFAACYTTSVRRASSGSIWVMRFTVPSGLLAKSSSA